MSDTYTNADLEAAEHALVAAGHNDEARALRQYTEGIRNLVQGEWGQSFVTALERLHNGQTATIAEAVREAVRSEVAAALGPFRSELAELRSEMASSAATDQERYDTLDALMHESQGDRADLRRLINELAERFDAQVAAQIADHEERIAKIEARGDG